MIDACEASCVLPRAQAHEADTEKFRYGFASEWAALLNKVLLSIGDKPQPVRLTTRSLSLSVLVESALDVESLQCVPTVREL
jgi:hypothetical protein